MAACFFHIWFLYYMVVLMETWQNIVTVGTTTPLYMMYICVCIYLEFWSFAVGCFLFPVTIATHLLFCLSVCKHSQKLQHCVNYQTSAWQITHDKWALDCFSRCLPYHNIDTIVLDCTRWWVIRSTHRLIESCFCDSPNWITYIVCCYEWDHCSLTSRQMG